MKFQILCALALIVAFVPAALYGADKGEALVEKYRAAHKAKDVRALKALVHWDGASERTREIIEKRLVRHLNLPITRIKFRLLSREEKVKIVGYHPNLEPVGWLVIFFKPPEGDSHPFYGEFFVVGEKDGEYVITVAETTH